MTCCEKFREWREEGRKKGYYFHVKQEILEELKKKPSTYEYILNATRDARQFENE